MRVGEFEVYIYRGWARGEGVSLVSRELTPGGLDKTVEIHRFLFYQSSWNSRRSLVPCRSHSLSNSIPEGMGNSSPGSDICLSWFQILVVIFIILTYVLVGVTACPIV